MVFDIKIQQQLLSAWQEALVTPAFKRYRIALGEGQALCFEYLAAG